MDTRFSDIINLIQQSRNNAIRAVNTELVNLYWNIGAYINQKLSITEWGDKTVDELALFIQRNNPELKGFERSALYRMVKFYETYTDTQLVSAVMERLKSSENQDHKIVASLRPQFYFQPQDIRETILAQVSWTHHRTIFARCKTKEEREFYLRLSLKENYSARELDRQISASLFERTMLGNVKLPSFPKEITQDVTNAFKDRYVFEFLNLPESHSESDLQKGLLKQMKNFILELGRDFIFIDEEYRLHVGNSDFLHRSTFLSSRTAMLGSI
jgi:predicted nuclease of restriction endonuclease-like (RecB) superfamily